MKSFAMGFLIGSILSVGILAIVFALTTTSYRSSLFTSSYTITRVIGGAK